LAFFALKEMIFKLHRSCC